MNLQPLANRIVAKIKDTESEQNIGGIIIPNSAKDAPTSAQVIAVGTGEEIQKLVNVGDTVIYKRFTGTEIEFESTKLIILLIDDIIAKISE